VAKVTRDRIMRAHAAQFPGYGFEAHKGYGTTSHMAAIAKLGPCPIHRLTFAPLKTMFPERAEAARGGPLGKPAEAARGGPLGKPAAAEKKRARRGAP